MAACKSRASKRSKRLKQTLHGLGPESVANVTSRMPKPLRDATRHIVTAAALRAMAAHDDLKMQLYYDGPLMLQDPGFAVPFAANLAGYVDWNLLETHALVVAQKQP